jgi:hypothetical protein
MLHLIYSLRLFQLIIMMDIIPIHRADLVVLVDLAVNNLKEY